MKSASQIASECNISHQQVRSVIEREGFLPALKKGKFKYYDEYQEELICEILFNSCLIQEIKNTTDSGYKRIRYLAKEIGIEPVIIQRAISKLKLNVKKINDKRIILINKDQEDKIINLLFLERKISEMIFESKINIPETFEEFKQRTYGKK